MSTSNICNTVKNFIEQHIDLIDQNNFEQLYKEWLRGGDATLEETTTCLADVFLCIDLNPTCYMTFVPSHYLYRSEQEVCTIAEGVEEIRFSAFHSNNKLTTIKFPSTLKNLWIYSIEYCPRIEELHLPDSVESLSNECLGHLPSLKLIHLPKNSKLTQLKKPFVDINPECNFKYSGTVAQYKKSIYNYNKTWKQPSSVSSVVYCSDGTCAIHG